MTVTEPKHSLARSEWANLSIQDRIHAIGSSIGNEHSPRRPSSTLFHTSQEESLRTDAKSELGQSERNHDDHSIQACRNVRRSVIEIWRERERENQCQAFGKSSPLPSHKTLRQSPKRNCDKSCVRDTEMQRDKSQSPRNSSLMSCSPDRSRDGPSTTCSSATSPSPNYRNKKLVVDTTLLPEGPPDTFKIGTIRDAPKTPPEFAKKKESSTVSGLWTQRCIKDASHLSIGLNDSKGSLEEEVQHANISSPASLRTLKQRQRRASTIDIRTQRELATANSSFDTRQSPASIMSTFFNKELEESKKSFDGVQNSFSSGGEMHAETSTNRPENLPNGRRSLSVLERWKNGMIHTDDFSSSQEISPLRKVSNGKTQNIKSATSNSDYDEQTHPSAHTGSAASLSPSRCSSRAISRFMVSPRRLQNKFEDIKNSPVSRSPSSPPTMKPESSEINLHKNFADKERLQKPTSSLPLALEKQLFFGSKEKIHTKEGTTGEERTTRDATNEEEVEDMKLEHSIVFGKLRDDFSQVGKVKSIAAAFSNSGGDTRPDWSLPLSLTEGRFVSGEEDADCSKISESVEGIKHDGTGYQDSFKNQKRRCDVASRWINRGNGHPKQDNKVSIPMRPPASKSLLHTVIHLNAGRDEIYRRQSLEHSSSGVHEGSFTQDCTQEPVLYSMSGLSIPIENTKPRLNAKSETHASRTAEQQSSSSPQNSGPGDGSCSEETSSSSSPSSSACSPVLGRLGAFPFSKSIRDDETNSKSVTTHGRFFQRAVSSSQKHDQEMLESSMDSDLPYAANESSPKNPHASSPTYSNYRASNGQGTPEERNADAAGCKGVNDDDKECRSNAAAAGKSYGSIIFSSDKAQISAQHWLTDNKYGSEHYSRSLVTPNAREPIPPCTAAGSQFPSAIAGNDGWKFWKEKSQKADQKTRRAKQVYPMAEATRLPKNHSPNKQMSSSATQHRSAINTAADCVGLETGQSDALSFFSHTGSAFSGYSAQSSTSGHNTPEELEKKSYPTGNVDRYAQELARKVLTHQETLPESYLAKDTKDGHRTSPKMTTVDSIQYGGAGLAGRYHTSSRFLSREDVLSAETSIGVDNSTISSALHASIPSSSYYSETSRSFDVSGASESAYTGISDVYSDKCRGKKAGVSKSKRNFKYGLSEAFTNVYQSCGVKKISDNITGSLNGLDLQQLTSGVNDSVQAASKTWREIINKSEPFSNVPVSRTATAKDVQDLEEGGGEENEERSVGEGIAIEVEYVSESDDETLSLASSEHASDYEEI